MKPRIEVVFLAVALVVSITSHAEDKAKPLETGAPAPRVSLTSLEGESVPLETIYQEKSTVLVFYRGGWCPYCTKHLTAVGEIEKQLKDLGYQVIAVSPDKPSEAKPYSEEHAFGYDIYTDPTAETAQGFGVAFRLSDDLFEKYQEFGVNLEARSGHDHHLLPHPAVFLIGTDGIIDYAYWSEDYKDGRLQAEDLLREAKAAKE